jgi:hypothetical protein
MPIKQTAMPTQAKRTTLLCLLAAGLAGCASDVPSSDTPVVVRFESTRVTASPSVAASTRAVATRTTADGSAWAAGDEIGIFMVQHAAPGTLAEGAVSNYPYTATPNAGTPAQASFAPSGANAAQYPRDPSDEVDFIAYYPYDADTELSEPKVINVASAQQSDPAALDLLHAVTTTGYNSQTTEAVPLTFTHVLSRLAMTVKAGSGVGSLVGLTLSINGLYTTANYDLATGTLSGHSTTVGITPHTVTSPSATDADGVYDALLLPDNVPTTATVTFALGGKTYTWYLQDDIPVLAPSKMYSYTITLNPSELTVTLTSGSATWNEGDKETVPIDN